MSRSNRRRRDKILRARVTPEEKKLAEAKARTMGSMGALFRAAVLGYTPPRSADRDVMVKLLAQFSDLRGEMGKIGSNFNQIAFHLNAGRPGDRINGALGAAPSGIRQCHPYPRRTAPRQHAGPRPGARSKTRQRRRIGLRPSRSTRDHVQAV
jgi:hypothetical protein